MKRMKHQKPRDEKFVVHIVAQTANAYARLVDEWFDLAVYYIDEKEETPDVGFSLKLIKPD